jgi:hypothetical protein
MGLRLYFQSFTFETNVEYSTYYVSGSGDVVIAGKELGHHLHASQDESS